MADPRTAAQERVRDRDIADRLCGRTIVRAVPRAGWDVDSKALRRWVHSWELHLDDGSIARFLTEETDGAEYGTDIVLVNPKEKS